jgi:hypothetical protein
VASLNRPLHSFCHPESDQCFSRVRREHFGFSETLRVPRVHVPQIGIAGEKFSAERRDDINFPIGLALPHLPKQDLSHMHS